MNVEELLNTRPVAMSLRFLCSVYVDELVAAYIKSIDSLKYALDNELPGLKASNFRQAQRQWQHLLRASKAELR